MHGIVHWSQKFTIHECKLNSIVNKKRPNMIGVLE